MGGTTPETEETIFKGRVHLDLRCVNCHPGASEVPHPRDFRAATCESCHSDVPPHVVRRKGQPPPQPATPLPDCIRCHGYHGISAPADPDSPVGHTKVPSLCAQCHDGPEPGVRSARAYLNSVHGRAHEREPEGPAAVCTDCHGAHGMRTVEADDSPVGRARVALTCAKCHEAIHAQYEDSVHGVARRGGVADAPTCTDCHGEHDIRPPTDPLSSVYPTHIAHTCGKCHDDEEVQRKYGLPAERMASFVGSYHGVASQYGDTRVANCASCHGVHDILPSSDPRSRVNKANLARTCGECHEGATDRFAEGSVHVLPSPHRDRVIYYVRLAYQIFIALLISSFVAYIVLEVFAHVRRRRRGEAQRIPWRWSERHEPDRFTTNEKVQHWVLVASFFVLVITGLALMIPDTPAARFVMTVTGGPKGRAIIHRIAGAVLILGFLYHLVWLFATRTGRAELRAFWPRRRDVTDILKVLKRNVGLASDAPKFARFNFAEKGEYYAVIWGTIVMGAT
ncbi:MAG: cytochrome c3 family protein, partial [Armatimonadota bacterium]